MIIQLVVQLSFLPQHQVSGDTVYVVGLSTTADLTRTINFVIDAGSAPMSSGIKGEMTLDVTGEIQSWTVLETKTGRFNLTSRKLTMQTSQTLRLSVVMKDHN